MLSFPIPVDAALAYAPLRRHQRSPDDSHAAAVYLVSLPIVRCKIQAKRFGLSQGRQSQSGVDVNNSALPFTVSADLDLGQRISPYLVDGAADVEIRRGEVPETLGEEKSGDLPYQISGSRMLLKVPSGIRYLIEDGCRIVYSRSAEHEDGDVSLFLLGSAWAALCYQRGLIPLHASAVYIDGKVHAFTGRPGAGKSTLAAALSARGHPFFTDDVLIIDPARLSPDPLCFTGQKDLKLWRDAIELTGAARGVPVRSVAGFDKHYATPTNPTGAVAGVMASLVVLREGGRNSEPEITPIRGAPAINALRRAVYRPIFAEKILGNRALWQGLAGLAGKVQVMRFTRRMMPDEFDSGVAFMARWIEAHD
ncbi:hypothetical protein OM513_16590 [Sphingomonas canadensis]|nr:hypothetical protein [Sphingomonas canadensis]MCW3837667.1 hypothetical protein [Sphingomonas canadensis]